MVDPVVSSRFGKRPLLEVPALQVSGHSGIEVPSLQAPAMAPVSTNPFPSAPNPMLGSGTYNPQPGYYTSAGLPPAPMVMGGYNRSQSAPQPMPIPFPAQQPGPYPPQGRAFYYGPNGETIYPAPFYNPQAIYPGVLNPVPGYPPPMRVPMPPYGLAGFNVTCELEYGRITNIDVRDSQGDFRGIPDFLRTELMRTYGQYPFTEVSVKLEGGEFHIYATHENRRRRRRGRRRDRGDSDSDYEDDYDDERYHHGLPDWKSEVESYTSGVRPRNPGSKPRGIIREQGWNRYR